MNYVKKTWGIFDNYVLSRWQNRPSTAAFWYLPEPPKLTNEDDLRRYQASANPTYLIDYKEKLNYSLENSDGIIVLPYEKPIGNQLNPEAAFQYALGLHDRFFATKEQKYLDKFWHYVHYFLDFQTQKGLFEYQFDWFGSKAPWHSALAQARGAAVMLRAYLLSQDKKYLHAAENALHSFTIETQQGGFLHPFSPANCYYYEEYPLTPTGVLNGFMASLMNIWELAYWTQSGWLKELWERGITSLTKMLPFYNTGWWSLYDLDESTPVINVNSPRYHLLEIHYLQILSLLSNHPLLKLEYEKRSQQYQHIFYRYRALSLKLLRKILYK